MANPPRRLALAGRLVPGRRLARGGRFALVGRLAYRLNPSTMGLTHLLRCASTLEDVSRMNMRITKLIWIAAALLSIAPVGISAQSSGAKKTQAKVAVIRSDVRELPADQQIIQALNRLTFGAKPGDALKVRAGGLDNWIDQQLHPEKINDDAMTAFVSNYSALSQNQNDLLAQYADQQRARQQV